MDAGDGEPDPRSGPLAAVRWFLETNHEGVSFVREVLSSALAVLLVGLLLFAVSGVWPPMVAVSSESMEPHMYKGDLVFVMEEHRFAPEIAVAGTGVVPYQTADGADYWTFGDHGDVVVYKPYGSDSRVPIIHRARFWVDEGENWYPRANQRFVDADSCEELLNCPAPHSGFITKGDNNRYYDQATRISTPVRPEWIRGTAEFRVPWLGWVRLAFSGVAATGPTHAPGVSPGAAGVTLDASGTALTAVPHEPSGTPEPPAASDGSLTASDEPSAIPDRPSAASAGGPNAAVRDDTNPASALATRVTV